MRSCGFIVASLFIVISHVPLDMPVIRLYIFDMKELLRSTDLTIIAFATALLRGEDIDCFEMDVNMSVLEGGIGIFPRRLMVHPNDHDAALRVMRDNEIPLGL
tara:strand:+ start:877 stop:1185 length:309 start_codon:yes stop_codon:yes gene_type:complete